MMKNTLASLLFGLLLVPVAFVPTAEAKPCCQTCDGWNDGEPPIGYDYCWDNCYICSEGGWECSATFPCGGAYVCMGGWCVFGGGEFSADETEPETFDGGCGAPDTAAAECSVGVTNDDGSVSCFDVAAQ